MPNAAITSQQSTKHSDDSSSDGIPVGCPPGALPPEVADFEELEKKFVDVLVDSLRYVATTSGIVIAMYSQSLREYLKEPRIAVRPLAQLLLLALLLLWFGAIVGTVLGIFPRNYRATTDAEKDLPCVSFGEAKSSGFVSFLRHFCLASAFFYT